MWGIYDVAHYQAALIQKYATRPRKALAPEDWEQLFSGRSGGLFGRDVHDMRVRWQPAWGPA